MELTIEDISRKLLFADRFVMGDRVLRILFLIPSGQWRPLEASWWKGKEVCIIGGDEDGNYLLRHCDGSVRLWEHARRADHVLAPSVRAFLSGLSRVT